MPWVGLALLELIILVFLGYNIINRQPERVSIVSQCKPCVCEAPSEVICEPKLAPANETNTPAAVIPQKQNSLRISMIEKIVPLTPEQRSNLELKFSESKDSDQEIAEVIGADNFKFYKEQTRKVFEAAKQEEFEKESFWLSRKLKLSEVQEKALIELRQRVEKQSEEMFKPKDFQNRIEYFSKKSEFTTEMMLVGMQSILDDNQYKNYQTIVQSSTERNFGVWHSPN